MVYSCFFPRLFIYIFTELRNNALKKAIKDKQSSLQALDIYLVRPFQSGAVKPTNWKLFWQMVCVCVCFTEDWGQKLMHKSYISNNNKQTKWKLRQSKLSFNDF